MKYLFYLILTVILWLQIYIMIGRVMDEKTIHNPVVLGVSFFLWTWAYYIWYKTIFKKDLKVNP